MSAAGRSERGEQDPSVTEREQALVRQSAEARAERLAAAKKRVELFSTPAAARPKVELFGAAASGAGANSAAASAKPRIELFGSAHRTV